MLQGEDVLASRPEGDVGVGLGKRAPGADPLRSGACVPLGGGDERGRGDERGSRALRPPPPSREIIRFPPGRLAFGSGLAIAMRSPTPVDANVPGWSLGANHIVHRHGAPGI